MPPSHRLLKVYWEMIKLKKWLSNVVVLQLGETVMRIDINFNNINYYKADIVHAPGKLWFIHIKNTQRIYQHT